MPVYEYRCDDCQAHSSIWFSSFAKATTATAVCNACGSEHLQRLVSRFAIARSGALSTERAAAPATSLAHGTDPRSLAQAMHASANGRDLGSDFREVSSRLDKGEQAASIEASLRQRVGETTQGH